MTHAVETDNVEKHYQMGSLTVEALRGVDVAIDQGEFVSIMGPSGSGKSTLMHILGLLDTPTSGTVHIQGRDTSTLNERQRAAFRLKKTGFVFQFYSLLQGFTALENTYLPLYMAGYPVQTCRKKAKETLEAVGLSDRIQHKPGELSGGQRQRVAIARAMVNDPDIILADEPNSQLDTKTSRQIMDLFRQISEDGNTVIMVNHERELGEMSDRIIWLEDGLVVDSPET